MANNAATQEAALKCAEMLESMDEFKSYFSGESDERAWAYAQHIAAKIRREFGLKARYLRLL